METPSSHISTLARRPDKQVNFKVAPGVLDAFDAVCNADGVSRTERLTRLMTSYAGQKLEGRLFHLDGSLCPLAAATLEITKVMRSTIMIMTKLHSTGQAPEVS